MIFLRLSSRDSPICFMLVDLCEMFQRWVDFVNCFSSLCLHNIHKFRLRDLCPTGTMLHYLVEMMQLLQMSFEMVLNFDHFQLMPFILLSCSVVLQEIC